jgi:anaerobic selenocysteine-containing dehydrogenase
MRSMSREAEQHKENWAYTICAGCYNLCGVKVKVVDGVPVAVEGVPESDLGGQGGMCGKGVATIMDLHDPNRIKYPVKRTNPKKGIHENPGWERISWDEALGTIAEHLKSAMKTDPRKFVWSFTPGPGTPFKATIYHSGFCICCGSRNQAFGGVGSQCGAAAHHAGALMHAAWDILPDYQYCNLVIRCGGNEGHGGGRMAATSMRLAAQARDRGMRTIVMDPIGFKAAADADEWIPVLPATDIAVFLAMARLIVHDIGIYDREYIRHKTNGVYLVGPDLLFVRDKEGGKPLIWDEKDQRAKPYDDPTLTQPALEGEFSVNGVKCHPGFHLWKEVIRQYDPGWASEISTVPAKRISRLAEELVETAKVGSTIEIGGKTFPYRPACVVGYKGVQTHQNAFHQYLAMNLLNILMGNQDVPGGIVGSGTVRSFGHPETGRPRFEPYASVDGMLTPGFWHTRTPWPPHDVEEPGMVNLLDVMADSSMNPYPYTDDFEEIWTKIGRPYEIEVFGMYGGNVVMNIGNSKTARNLLAKIPFMFSINTVHNETTEGFADIVLPDVHAYESYDVASSIGFFFNYPIGMQKWSFHVRMPTYEPQWDYRDTLDIYFELADRIGIREKYNNFLENYFSAKSSTWEQKEIKDTKPVIVGPDEKITAKDFTDRVLKFYFGEKRGLDWFREHGFMTWEKKPEEAYWRYFINARVPMFFETVAKNKPKIKEIFERIGIHMNWDYYSPLISYFPSVIYTELPPDSEFDLLGVSYRDVLHTHRFFLGNPLVDEMSASNPYTFNIVMNAETGKKKGIQDGDIIGLQSHWGDTVEGRVKLSLLIHPRVVAVVGLGGWAKGRPIAKGKGVNFNELLRADYKHMCPVVGSFEIVSRIKAYTVKRGD